MMKTRNKHHQGENRCLARLDSRHGSGKCQQPWNHRTVMAVSHILLAMTLLPLLLFHSRDIIRCMYIVALLHSMIKQFSVPAQGALLPSLLEEKQFITANSLVAVASTIASVFGPPVGGGLLEIYGFGSVVAVDSITFLFSAGMIALITVPRNPRIAMAEKKDPAQQRRAASSVWQGWMIDGLRLIRDHGILRGILVTQVLFLISQGIGAVFLRAYPKTKTLAKSN